MSNVEGVLQFLNQLVIKTPKVRIVNNIRGRSLVAAQHIKKDEHLFTSTPLVAWPKKQTTPIRLDRNCNHCFAPNNQVSECQACRMDKLFMHNMKKYHKLVKTDLSPSEISSQSSRFEPMVNKLAFRLCKEIQDGYENTNYILNLLSCPDISSDIQEGLTGQYEFLKTELISHGVQKEMESFLSLEWYCRTLGVLHLNAVGTPLPVSGSALYDDISFINHSCSPTVGLLFHGMRATVVSLKDLNPNDELFMNYVELNAEKEDWSHEDIQENLRYNYGFDCSTTCSCGRIEM
jgi:hypothetical protein